ncbi:MAG: very short patch repair endonuclease [Nitrospirota bacterium]
MERKLKKYLKNGKFDNVTEVRSKTMSAIRGKNNRTTEVKLRMALIRGGFSGFKLHANELPGTPDFYFEKDKLALFVDGCYWHGCPKCGHIPKTRSEFWKAKINRTKQRDRKKRTELRKQGMSVLRIWEHELKDRQSIIKVLSKISEMVYSN